MPRSCACLRDEAAFALSGVLPVLGDRVRSRLERTLCRPSSSVLRSPAGALLRFLVLLDFFRRCIDSVTRSGVERGEIGPRGSLRLDLRVGVRDACVCGVVCGVMAAVIASVTRV